MTSGINAWAVGVLRYGAVIVDWTMEQLVSMERRTRKILTMIGYLHTRSNIARIYLPKKEGVIGLINTEKCVKERKSLRASERPQSGCFLLL